MSDEVNIKQQQIINDKDEAINELLKQIEEMKKDVARGLLVKK